MKAAKPNSYCAKNFVVTLDEIKAFFGCRVTMEMLIHKDRFEQYWLTKDNLLVATPGFANVMTCDRFLAIGSMLHCVDEDDPNVDKDDKIYKSRHIMFRLVSYRWMKV